MAHRGLGSLLLTLLHLQILTPSTTIAPVLAADVTALPTPVICQDTIGGQTPFNANNIPCILGCGTPIAIATGGLLPGSVNETDIPYCQLNCVHHDATPAQSSAAPGCHQRCMEHNEETPENSGWCMYWCVDGLGDLVASTSCVPALQFGSGKPSLFGGETVTIRGESFHGLGFITPAAYKSWFATQTILPKAVLPGQGQSSPTSTDSATTAAETSGILHATSPTTQSKSNASIASQAKETAETTTSRASKAVLSFIYMVAFAGMALGKLLF